MTLLQAGFNAQKFFPAEAAGGLPLLKAWSAPLPEVSFCPTGGITLANAADYLALPNVACVGGSWIAPSDAVARRSWDTIADAAAEARRRLS